MLKSKCWTLKEKKKTPLSQSLKSMFGPFLFSVSRSKIFKNII